MIYICIPAYDEERTVGVLLWKIRSVMREFGRDYQILVLNDGSTDGTADVLSPYARVMPLTVLRNAERKGYGAACEALLREAVTRSSYPRRDAVVTLQADFTDEPEEIPALVKRIEAGADVVTSRAQVNGSPAPSSVLWAGRFLRYVARRGGWPDPVTDPLSGFRAYRVITLRKAIEARNGARLIGHDGWAANAELLRAVVPFARRLDETGVQAHYHRRHRDTRFRPWLTTLQVLRVLRGKPPVAAEAEAGPEILGVEPAPAAEKRRQGGRRRGGRKRPPHGQRPARAEAPAAEGSGTTPASGTEVPEEPRPRRKSGGRRRGRRGGRGGQRGGAQQRRPDTPGSDQGAA